MQKIKHIVSLFLLLIMLVVGCRFLLFQSYLRSQKSEFRKTTIQTGSKKLQHLVFTKNTLYKNLNGYEWKHQNKELVIKGQYHEVLAVIDNHDHYDVIIIADNAENEMFKHFFDSETKKVNSLAYHLLHFMQLSFFENTPEVQFQNSVSTITYPLFVNSNKTSEHLYKLIKPPAFFIS